MFVERSTPGKAIAKLTCSHTRVNLMANFVYTMYILAQQEAADFET